MAEGGHRLSLLGDQRIIKQGFLEKRGEYIKNWRQRYFFLLDNGDLLGFKTKPLEELSNPLNNFTVQVCCDLSYLPILICLLSKWLLIEILLPFYIFQLQ